MHAAERENLIMQALARTGFVTYRELEANLDASPATIRRDLAKLEDHGQIIRVHGGARLREEGGKDNETLTGLQGTPFDTSLAQNSTAKSVIGQAAANLCKSGEGIIIDGGTTTYSMCPHLAGKKLQVLTNSLHIVNALLPQQETRLLLPSGTLFREQNIILAPGGEDSMPIYHAARLFMVAAAVGPHGISQADAVLVAAQRRFMACADTIVLLVDSSKFASASGTIVCGLNAIDLVITDSGISQDAVQLMAQHDVDLQIAK